MSQLRLSLIHPLFSLQSRNSGAGASDYTNCPNISCISTAYFGAFIVGQMVLFLLYGLYSSRKEAAAKKFY